MQTQIKSNDYLLPGCIFFPPKNASMPLVHVLILCHDFPVFKEETNLFSKTYCELADRISQEVGWTVLYFNFSGIGDAPGSFSLSQWLNDLKSAVDFVYEMDKINGVWLAGFGVGGGLALCAAAEDARIKGVASFGAWSDFNEWSNPELIVDLAKRVGAIKPKHQVDLDKWRNEFKSIKPIAGIGKVPPRSLLIVHGSEDEVAPAVEARALSNAAEEQVELRVIPGAKHRIRDDPRAIAILLGWLDRQFV